MLGGGGWSRFRPPPTPPDYFYLSPALRGLGWEEGAQVSEQAAVAVLFALWRLFCCLLLLCLPSSACFAACSFCMTAGWDTTPNAIILDVAPRRRFCLASPQPAARGLLSLASLLGAFLLHVIERNQA